MEGTQVLLELPGFVTIRVRMELTVLGLRHLSFCHKYPNLATL